MRWWPFKRKAKTWPTAGQVIRDYDAADTSPLFADFKLDGGWVPSTMAHQLPVMRARSRNAAKNNPWVKRSLQLSRVNVVGENGFTFVPRPPFDADTVDDVAAKIIKRAWRKWSTNPKYCDVAGLLDFKGFCNLSQTQVDRDGEAILRMHRFFDFPDNPFGFALQTLNSAMLDANLNIGGGTVQRGMVGAAIINGVEINGLGRPLAYWFKKQGAAERIYQADYVLSGGHYTRIPADEILHVYDREMSEQTRGVPALYSILETLHMLDRYERAELVAARKDANLSSSYKSQGMVDPEHLAPPKAVTAAINASAAGQDKIVPYGWERITHAPSRPNTAFAPFDKQMLRKVSSGTGQNYNTLANDGEGISYSSMRGLTQVERDIYKSKQSTMIRDLCSPCYLAWLGVWLSTPKAPLPIAKYDKFAVHSFRGRRWQWVDPRAEAIYNEMCRKYGWKSDQEIAEELGNDMAENLAEIEATANLATGTYVEQNYATNQDNQTGATGA